MPKERIRSLECFRETDKSVMFLPQSGENGKDFKGLLKIFSIEKKRELSTHCKNLAINQLDLANLIRVAEFGALDSYAHVLRNKILQPGHLNPTNDELAALSQSKVGCAAEGKAHKAIKKIFQMFDDRRYFVAHFFFLPDQSRWHLLYFDQRDMEEREDHWGKGGHIHLINWLWPQYTLESVWNEVISEKPVLKRSLHIQYVDQPCSPGPFFVPGDR